MKIKAIIVDDEPLAVKVIENHLMRFHNITVAAIFQNPIKASNYLTEHQIDVVFLDINMPDLSGLDMIKNTQPMPLTVITTAYRAHAVEGYELNVFDYLVKPIAFSRFEKCIHKVIDHFRTKNLLTSSSSLEEENAFLFVKVDKKMVKVFFSEILYVESLKDYVRVVTKSENLITHANLGNFTSTLPPDKFLRIHRSYTIALDKVKALEGNNIEIDHKKIPIGRNYQTAIKKQILHK